MFDYIHAIAVLMLIIQGLLHSPLGSKSNDILERTSLSTICCLLAQHEA